MWEILDLGMHLSWGFNFQPRPFRRTVFEELVVCKFQASKSVKSSNSSDRYKHMKLLRLDYCFYLPKQQSHIVY